ncbi:MAG: hypothetical protein IKU52_05410 [Clostridia bacterium]|nr:hypothetical protein [Clostridia bacterium]
MYSILCSKYEVSNSETELKELGLIFNSFSNNKEYFNMAKRCFAKAEICRKNSIYDKAMNYYYEDNVESYNKAIHEFYSIHPFRDTSKKIKDCNDRIFKIKAKQQKALFEREKNFKTNSDSKITDTIKILIIGGIIASIALFIVYLWSLIPNI